MSRKLVLCGVVIALACVGWICALSTTTIASKQTSYFSDRPDVRTATTYHPVSTISGSNRESKKEAEWREIQSSPGHWVKEGRYVRWSVAGAKLEEGSYANDKRQGSWTFWDENGIVDPSRSGKYDDDVRTEPALSPKGDFDDDK